MQPLRQFRGKKSRVPFHLSFPGPLESAKHAFTSTFASFLVKNDRRFLIHSSCGNCCTKWKKQNFKIICLVFSSRIWFPLFPNSNNLYGRKDLKQDVKFLIDDFSFCLFLVILHFHQFCGNWCTNFYNSFRFEKLPRKPLKWYADYIWKTKNS